MAGEPDRQIADLAAKQHGYVTRHQALDLGLSRQGIVRRVAAARLIPVYAGVYAVGHMPTLAQDRAYGAVLACGRDAVLSHDTAACVWGIYRRWTSPFHVTAPGVRRRSGIHGHRDRLHRRDIDRQHGLPVTSPARTLLDNAPDLKDSTLTRAVNDLRRQHYLSLGDLAELLSRCARHRGASRLREFIENPSGPTASEFEDALRAFCRRFNFPEPLINTTLAGFEVDAYFPVERVIIELDGWEFHSSRYSFINDRDRDATLLALGIVTVRITWERLIETPEREAGRLLAILDGRRRLLA
jgi:very-short-patch-repair endonuclease